MSNKSKGGNKKFKVSFIVEEYPSFKGCVNWSWIKKEALRDIFEPYGKVSKLTVEKIHQSQERRYV